MNRYYNPVRTLEGPGSTNQLTGLLEEMGLEKRKVLLLVWSKNVLNNPGFSSLLKPEAGFEIQTVCFEASNPTVNQLFAVYEATRDFSPEAVVAVGGGSTMDVGKSLCCLYGHRIPDVDALREMIREKNYGTPQAQWIGVPTTAGTGSEVTCWATIWDPEQDAKRSVECRENYAWAALVDPHLTEGMPLKLAVSSGLDAAAHAVESYWARGTNCVSRALALEAVRLVMENMEGLLAGQQEAKEAMSRGSMLAGLAFSNTKTTACHSISYPLTMHYQIPHGTAVSMLLAPLFKRNLPVTADGGRLAAALGAADGEELGKRIRSILDRSGQPSTLKEWGVKREDLPRMASLGLTKGRADNNPLDIDEATILEILEEIYD